MRERSRAERRHQVARIKNNRKNYWGSTKSPRKIGMLLHTPKPCSCWMCGNPRRLSKDKLTVQEKRFSQDELFLD